MIINEIIPNLTLESFLTFFENIDNKKIILSEKLDDSKISQLENLTTLSTLHPTIGDKYIPVTVMYAHDDTIMLSGSKSPKKLIDIHNRPDHDVFVFDESSYPSSRITNNIYFRTYLFDSTINFDKFMMMVGLSFSNIKSTLVEYILYKNRMIKYV